VFGVPAARLLALAAVAGILLMAPPVAAASARGNPFRGARLYVDPESAAARQVRDWRDNRPHDARLVKKIADQPEADWLGEWYADPAAHVRDQIAHRLSPAHATAFFALYAIPHRDCAGYSGGSMGSGDAYRAWVDQIAGAIGRYPAIVLVEPDALPEVGCLSHAAQKERLGLEAYATRRLGALPRTSVYIDAGSANWGNPRRIVRLLRAAGVRHARGFALGTTSFDRTSDNLRYGRRIGRALHGKHFIINTARNGRGPLPRARARSRQDMWCNPPDRGLGARPTTHTRSRLADAYAWTNHPGYSDGPCNGGPPAGQWWAQYALGLARRAAF
jgi:endoglucanase